MSPGSGWGFCDKECSHLTAREKEEAAEKDVNWTGVGIRRGKRVQVRHNLSVLLSMV